MQTTMVEEPFVEIAIDTVGPLVEDELSFKYIIVAIDCFSRFVELKATKLTTAGEAAKLLVELFGRYGAPRRIRSDGGTQYDNALISAIQLIGVEYQDNSVSAAG